jgi:hypothetical protein
MSEFNSTGSLTRYGIASLFVRIHGNLLKERERCGTNPKNTDLVDILVEEGGLNTCKK